MYRTIIVLFIFMLNNAKFRADIIDKNLNCDIVN